MMEPVGNDEMSFDEWLEIGVANKWCGWVVCATHDGLPTSNVEDRNWEDGADPCVHIVRLYEDEATADAVNNDFFPYQWRKRG